MELTAEVACPWCGEPVSLAIDTSQPDQCFVTDCEVCCRPFEVQAECEPGEILRLETLAG